MKNRIKEIRKNEGKTQVDFASELGVSPSNIISYETGRRSPSDAMIRLICDKYGINENWVRTGEGEMLAPVAREVEIAKIAADLFQGDNADIKIQLQKVVAGLNEKEIQALVDIAEKIVRAKEKSLT